MQGETETDAIRPFESRIRDPIINVARARIRSALLDEVDSVDAHLLGLERTRRISLRQRTGTGRTIFHHGDIQILLNQIGASGKRQRDVRRRIRLQRTAGSSHSYG